jgi:iron(III) transport system substrate-binding protein
MKFDSMPSRSVLRRSLLSLGLVAAALAASPAQAADAGLTIYNSQDEGPVEALAAAYEKKTGVKVDIRDNGAPALAGQIAEEGEKTPADIFYAEYTTALVTLAQKGLLTEVPAATFAEIPARFHDGGRTWMGLTARSFVILYNKTMIEESKLPASIVDLAKPEWAGKFAYNPHAPAFLELVIAVDKTIGRDATLEWLRGMKANGTPFPKNTAMVLAVDRGEIATAVNADKYWLAVAKERGADTLNARVHYIGHKDPGALLTLSGIGIPKFAPHRAEAEKFLAFAASEEGQTVLAASGGDVPLRPGIAFPDAMKPLDQLDPSPVTAAEIGDAKAALEIERAVGIN